MPDQNASLKNIGKCESFIFTVSVPMMHSPDFEGWIKESKNRSYIGVDLGKRQDALMI